METPTIAVPMHMENTEGLRSTGQQNQHNQYNNSQHSNSKGSNIHSNNHNIHLRSAQPQIASAQTPPFGQRNFAGSERAHIAATLRKAVGPEFLAQRAGPGGSKLVYIPGNRVISLANDVFGFDGWSHSILGSEIDFCDTSRDGLISLGISTIVRVTLKDGTSHEDVGYGSIENARSKGTAFDKAKKESVTDAIKRALRSFGNVMGNCTYNTELTKKIIQMPKIPPPIYDASNIYRGEEYMEGGFKAIAMAAAAASIASESAKKMTVQQSIDPVAQFEDDDLVFCGDLEGIDSAFLTVPTTNGGLSLSTSSATMQQPAFVRPKPVSNIQKPTLSSTIGSHSNNTTSNASKINTPIQAQQLSNQIISNNINSNNNVNNFGTKNNVNNFGTNTNNAIVSNSSSTFNSNTPTKSTTSPTNTRPQQQQTQLVRTHLPQQGTATPTVALTPNNSINKKPQNILQIQSSIKPNLSNNNNASNNNNNNNNNINTNKSSSTQLPTRFPNPVESSSGSNNSGGNSGLSIKGPPPPQHQPPSVNWNSSGVHGGLLGGVGQPGKRPLVSESTTSNQPFLFAAGGIGNGSMNSGLPGMSRAIGSVSVGLSNGGNNGVGVAGVSYNYGNTNVKKQKM